MKNKFSNNAAVLYIVMGLILGWLITSLFLTPSWTGYPINPWSMMGFRSNNVTNIDRHFIEQMIPHHEDAITMAKVALEKAKRPEIKSLAQSILTNQNTEITQMTMWYAKWYGQMVPSNAIQMGTHGMVGTGGMHMGMMGDETDVTSLSLAIDFDREFIRQMIPHHQMAVIMATMLENSTSKDEMKQLAKNIITVQNREIADMRSWYASWYK